MATTTKASGFETIGPVRVQWFRGDVPGIGRDAWTIRFLDANPNPDAKPFPVAISANAIDYPEWADVARAIAGHVGLEVSDGDGN